MKKKKVVVRKKMPVINWICGLCNNRTPYHHELSSTCCGKSMVAMEEKV